MKQLFGFVVLIAVFQFCVSVPEDCTTEPYDHYDNSAIHLTFPKSSSEDNIERKEYLQRFISLARRLNRYKIKVIPEFCPGGVRGTIEAVKHVPNFINLFVDDFYEFNYAETFYKNIFFAGNTRLQKYNKTCTFHAFQDVCNNNRYDVKLISESIIDRTILYRFVVNFSFMEVIKSDDLVSLEDIPNHSTILVCIENLDITSLTVEKSIYDSVNFLYDAIENCNNIMERQKHNIITVLASKPFATNYETAIPTLFYNQPYLSQEDKTSFSNSMSVVSNWKQLKHAFVKFMDKMKWTRVAVISDDSEYSEEFEAEMSHELAIKGFSYHSYLCSHNGLSDGCDFDKMMKSLHKDKAKIVIVNIGEKNAAKFHEEILMKDTAKHIVWLVRDWPFKTIKIQSTSKHVYTISLAVETEVPKTENVESNRHSAGIRIINEAYKKVEGQANIRQSMYRELRSRITGQLDALAFITKIDVHHRELVMILSIKQSEVIVKSGSNYHTSQHDRIPCELLNADNYLDPCGDQEFLLIILVIIIFLIVLLLVIHYVNNLNYFNSYTTM